MGYHPEYRIFRRIFFSIIQENYSLYHWQKNKIALCLVNEENIMYDRCQDELLVVELPNIVAFLYKNYITWRL